MGCAAFQHPVCRRRRERFKVMRLHFTRQGIAKPDCNPAITNGPPSKQRHLRNVQEQGAMRQSARDDGPGRPAQTKTEEQRGGM
jgi:hypothetical protein